MPTPSTLSRSADNSADSFLHLQTKRAGKIKGEATSAGHEDDIIVTGWHWGLTSHAALGGGNNKERRSYTALTIEKRIDRASTGLMSALVSNDEVKEAKLTLRRAGGKQEEYFTITVSDARVASLNHDTDADGYPREIISIVFTKIEAEYTPQLATGLRSGSTNFVDEIYAA